MTNSLPSADTLVNAVLKGAAPLPPLAVLAELTALARCTVGADFALILLRSDPASAEVVVSDPPDLVPGRVTRPRLVEGVLESGEPYFGAVTGSHVPHYLRGFHAVLPLGTGHAALFGRTAEHVAFTDDECHFLRALVGPLALATQWQAATRTASRLTARLDAIVNTLGQGVLFVDELEGEAWVNEPGAQLLGVCAGSVEPRHVAQGMAHLRSRAVDAAALEQQAARLASAQDAAFSDWHWVLAGEPRQVLNVSTVPVHAHGSAGRLWLFEDISDEQAAEEARATYEAALLQSERKYRDLYDKSPDMYMAGYPADHIIRDCNLTLAHTLGYSREELIGQANDVIFEPASYAKMIATLPQYIARKEFPNFEVRLQCKDGTLLDVLMSAVLEPGPDGGLPYSRVTFHDISERVRTQEQMQQTLDLLRLATDTAEIGIWTWNYADGKLEWDDLLCRFYQVPEAAQRSGLYYEFWRARLHPDDLAATEDSLLAARHSGTTWDWGFRIVLPDGAVRLLQSRAITERSSDGQPLRMIGVNRDITAQWEQEEALRAAKAAADAANTAKTEYLGLINHELRTPLNAILGLTQLMQADTDWAQSHAEDMVTVIESGNHMLTLINEVLDLAKIEAGKADIVEQDFDLHKLIHGVHAMLQPKMDAKRLAFVVDIAPEAPRYITTDEGKLRQVLLNLLNNAVKFTAEGGVSLYVLRDQLHKLHFRVVDTGPGIGPKQLERLFKPFSQTDSALTQQEGTGLGLSISAAYARMLGGDIGVTSTLGKGSTFFFDICCREAPAPAGAAGAEPRVVGLAPGTPNYRILIVDDVAANRYLMRKLLAPLGFELAEAADGVAALEAWEAWQPHLVFLDLMLPELDGFSVARQIRKLEAAAKQQGAVHHTYLAAATASVLRTQYQEILDSGCDAVLTKPYTRQQMLAMLQQGLAIEYVYTTPALPVLHPGSGTDPDASPQIQACSHAIQPADGMNAPLRVLVVDDNPVNQKVAAAMLKRLGYAADLASNGQEALDALRGAGLGEGVRYGLVLLDLQMPVMGGLEAARRMHAEWREHRPHLVAVTGGTSQEEQQACRDAGMDAWLPKPLRLEELKDVIERLLTGG